MTARPTAAHETPSATQQSSADTICNRFAAAWKAGTPPRIEDHAAGVREPLRTPLLRELIAVEVHHRRVRGEGPRPADYLARFPEARPEWFAPGPFGAADGHPAGRRYVITGEVGAGGMGRVYRARDLELDRNVAVKVIHPSRAPDDDHRRRFLREARALARVRSDYVVQIFDAGEAGGAPYLVMELLQGETLAARLHRLGALAPPDVVRLGADLARALCAVHGQGLVHRDLKPGNVWLEPPPDRPGHGPRAKLLDFGLVRAADRAALDSRGGDLTRLDARLGTPAYMSPEQAAGPHAVDHRTDLFSLGCVLYEAATGRRPFAGEAPRDGGGEALPPPSRLNPQVPPALSALTLELLATSPADRPPSAEDVLRRLSAPEQAPGRPARLRPWHLAAAAGAAVLAACLLAFWPGRDVEPPPRGNPNPPRADPAAPARVPPTPGPVRAGLDPALLRTDPDRAVARWALGLGATEVSVDDWVGVRDAQRLPPGRFRLVAVDFRDSGVNDGELSGLGGVPLRHLQDVNLTETSVTDAGLRHLTGYALTGLYAAGLRGVTDAGAEQIARIRSLQYLDLDGTSVTDAGLQAIGTLRALQELHLRGTAITDRGLRHLYPLGDLRHLHLDPGQAITPGGIGALKKALPACAVER